MQAQICFENKMVKVQFTRIHKFCKNTFLVLVFLLRVLTQKNTDLIVILLLISAEFGSQNLYENIFILFAIS